VTTCAFTAHAQLDGVAPGNTADEPWAGKAVAQPTRLNVTRAAKSPESKRSVVPAVVLGVLAVGGIGSGIGFTAAWSSNNSSANNVASVVMVEKGSCVSTWDSYIPKLCASLQSKLNAATTYGNVAIGTFIAGGAAAAGTALYLLWPSPRAAEPSVARDLRLTPMLGPTGGGLLVSGQF
jgi:hypothetical protein